MVVKPNTAGGSVSPSKSGPESVYYYLAVQYSWSIHPRETRNPGRRRWWAVPRVGCFFFVLDGRMCYCWNRGWEVRLPDLAGKFARMGAGRLGGWRVFSTGIPTSSYFLAASNGGLEA